MHDLWVSIKLLIGGIGFYVGFVLGPVSGLLIALLCFMALDYITGVISAILTKTLSSDVGFKGLARKCFILVLVAMGHLLDTYVLGFAGVRTMVIFWFLANEGVSILENSARIGLPVPEKLRDILEQLKEGNHNADVDT